MRPSDTRVTHRMQSMNGDTDDRLEIEKQHETVFGDQASRYRSAITALMCDGVFCAEDVAVRAVQR